MTEYYTKEQLASVAHISKREILQDIKDTKREIEVEEKKAKAHSLLHDAQMAVGDLSGAKMSDFRRSGALNAIAKRRAFVAKLEKLLRSREREDKNEAH